MAVARSREHWRIDRATEPAWPFAPLSTHRDTDSRIERWVSTHPPTAERIERLRRRAEATPTRPDREWTGVSVR